MQKKLSVLFALLALILSSCTVRYRHKVERPGTPAKWKYGAGGFARYDGYADVAGDLEIAISDHKKPGSQVTVKFVGVIHIGDKDYYKQIQKILDSCDLVLYEGVKIKGTNPFKQAKKPADMYWPMAQILGLSTQMHEIDYRRKHFKHCDVTIDRKQLTNKGPIQNMAKMMKTMKAIVPLKKKLAGIIPMRAMEDYLKHNYAIAFTRTKEVNFKNMGKQLEPMIRALELYRQKYPNNAFLNALYQRLKEMKANFERMGKFILEERNIHVMKELRKEIAKAEKLKKPYTIAVFYGAAHIADLERRLERELGYKRVKMEWLKAWKMNSRR